MTALGELCKGSEMVEVCRGVDECAAVFRSMLAAPSDEEGAMA